MCEFKVSSFQAKIDDNFANFFLKTEASNKRFIAKMYIKRAT